MLIDEEFCVPIKTENSVINVEESKEIVLSLEKLLQSKDAKRLFKSEEEINKDTFKDLSTPNVSIQMMQKYSDGRLARIIGDTHASKDDESKWIAFLSKDIENFAAKCENSALFIAQCAESKVTLDPKTAFVQIPNYLEEKHKEQAKLQKENHLEPVMKWKYVSDLVYKNEKTTIDKVNITWRQFFDGFFAIAQKHSQSTGPLSSKVQELAKEIESTNNQLKKLIKEEDLDRDLSDIIPYANVYLKSEHWNADDKTHILFENSFLISTLHIVSKSLQENQKGCWIYLEKSHAYEVQKLLSKLGFEQTQSVLTFE